MVGALLSRLVVFLALTCPSYHALRRSEKRLTISQLMSRNDILRKHKIIPEKPPSPTPMIEEALQQARKIAHDNRLENKDLDELDELEDEEDEEFLNSYRQKRMREMAELQSKSVYNQVYPIQKPDYAKEVTEESNKTFVFVLLTSSSGTNVESRRMIDIWRILAKKYGELKFCQIQADLCIEGYPDKNTPTVLIYKDGEIRKQIVTLRDLNGVRTDVEDVEKIFVTLGAVKVGDKRLSRKSLENEDEDVEQKRIKQGGFARSKRNVDDGEESDWD